MDKAEYVFEKTAQIPKFFKLLSKAIKKPPKFALKRFDVKIKPKAITNSKFQQMQNSAGKVNLSGGPRKVSTKSNAELLEAKRRELYKRQFGL